MFGEEDTSGAFWGDVAEQSTSGSLAVTLKIGAPRPKRLHLQVNELFIIGRRTADDLGAPDLDLTGYDAAQQGISQRHAALRHRNGALFIEDLESTNGTRINGSLLDPHRLYRLRHTDELELGLLRMEVELRAGGN